VGFLRCRDIDHHVASAYCWNLSTILPAYLDLGLVLVVKFEISFCAQRKCKAKEVEGGASEKVPMKEEKH
jgi:hypothetical protein